jgi:hypothetical protein
MIEEKLDQEMELDLRKLLGFNHHAASADPATSSGFVSSQHLAGMLGARCNKIGGETPKQEG